MPGVRRRLTGGGCRARRGRALRRCLSAALSGVVAAAAAVVAAGGTPAAVLLQDPFRAATELVLIDVSVLDEDRRPVRGLTARDFSVLIDGTPRTIVAFRAVDAAPAAVVSNTRAPARWTREVAVDVATNLASAARAIAIVVDDYSLAEARLDPGQVENARRTALAVIEALEPDDRAAVLFTGNGHTAQAFTSDRRLLRAAVERAAIAPEPPDNVAGIGPGDQGFCPCGVCSMDALERVARMLRDLPDQRKTVVYISAGSAVAVPRSFINPTSADVPDGALRMEHCNWERARAADRAMRQVQLANVTIQAFDPTGVHVGDAIPGGTVPKLSTGSGGAPANPQYTVLERTAVLRTESLRALAEATGGRAVVNHNDMHEEVPEVLAEGASYYLLGVEPPPATTGGRFHPVRVQAHRNGVSVRTRAGYYDRADDDRNGAAPADAAASYVAGPVPSAGLRLDVAAVPVAAADGSSSLAVTVAVHPPAENSRPLPHTDVADVVATLLNPESGAVVGSHEVQVRVVRTRADARFGFYEVLSALPAPPGRHELRVGVRTTGGRGGSVYTSVEVPEFGTALSASGLVLNASPAPLTGEAGGVREVLPVAPTSRRLFRPSDVVVAVLRVYQPSTDRVPVRVATTLQDAAGQVVAADALDVDGRIVGPMWTADYDVTLPTATLAPGDYLITVDVSAGERTVRRALRFRMER